MSTVADSPSATLTKDLQTLVTTLADAQLCLYGWFVLLYSCLHTHREWYRSRNYDIGPAKCEIGLHSNFVLVFVCVCTKGCMQKMVWIEPDKCESMLHTERQA